MRPHRTHGILYCGQQQIFPFPLLLPKDVSTCPTLLHLPLKMSRQFFYRFRVMSLSPSLFYFPITYCLLIYYSAFNPSAVFTGVETCASPYGESRHKPLNTLPGPTSRTVHSLAESPLITPPSLSSSSVQRTGCVRWSTADFFASSPAVTCLPVTLLKSGIAGSAEETEDNVFSKLSAAFCMSGEWNGPATARRMARRAPASVAFFSTSVSASNVPLTTVCFTEFIFAAYASLIPPAISLT